MKWASANDYCEADLLAACIKELESDSSVVLCYGRTRLVDETTGAERPYDGDFAILDKQPSARLACLWAHMKLNNAISGLIRMDILRKTGLIRSYAGGDLVLMAELAMAGLFVLLPIAKLYRRMGEHTFSSHLTDVDLRTFLNPQARFGAGLDQLRMNVDYFLSVLRASMSLGETCRGLTLAARHAYWDVLATVGNSRRTSGVRR
jgi:hypothetical protein